MSNKNLEELADMHITIKCDTFAETMTNAMSLLSANPWLRDKFAKDINDITSNPDKMMVVPDMVAGGLGNITILPTKALVDLVNRMHAAVNGQG